MTVVVTPEMIWPLAALRLRTPRLELRLPTEAEPLATAVLISGEPHDPAGSWIRPEHRGTGLGTEMRAAVLHLSFNRLRAVYATSRTPVGNQPSLRVSRKPGYRADGIDVESTGGQVTMLRRLRLTARRWSAHDQRHPVRVSGLPECRELLGLR